MSERHERPCQRRHAVSSVRVRQPRDHRQLVGVRNASTPIRRGEEPSSIGPSERGSVLSLPTRSRSASARIRRDRMRGSHLDSGDPNVYGAIGAASDQPEAGHLPLVVIVAIRPARATPRSHDEASVVGPTNPSLRSADFRCQGGHLPAARGTDRRHPRHRGPSLPRRWRPARRLDAQRRGAVRDRQIESSGNVDITVGGQQVQAGFIRRPSRRRC
jgi:hypothetical protein